jgi:hypothetical protein
MSLEEEPAPVPEPVAGDVPDALLPVCGPAAGDDDFVSVLLEVEGVFVSVLGLADGDFVSEPFVSPPVLAGVFVSALEPLPPEVLLAPALDDEPLPELLAPPAL